jgi:hypothetical protein
MKASRQSVRTQHAWRSHALRKRGGGRGLPVSRGSLFEDQLFQRQIRDGAPKPSVLSFQLLQPFDLIAFEPAIFRPPAIICKFRHAYRSHRFRDRSPLRRQHVNLPQLRDDLLRRVSLPRHPRVLHQAQSHTSGRTISQGQTKSPIEKWQGQNRRLVMGSRMRNLYRYWRRNGQRYGLHMRLSLREPVSAQCEPASPSDDAPKSDIAKFG